MAQRFYWKQYVTDKQVTFYIADLILKPGEQRESRLRRTVMIIMNFLSC